MKHCEGYYTICHCIVKPSIPAQGWHFMTFL